VTHDAPEPPEECTVLKLSSGTTGTPKAVAFSAEQLLADCTSVCDTMQIRASDRNFGLIPFSHSYGFSNLITPLLCRGVPLVVAHDRIPRAICEGIKASEATVFPATPVIFQALADLEGMETLGALRLCISAGAMLPVETGLKFLSRFGLKLHAFYGSSECGGIAYDASDIAISEPGYVGTPMRDVEILPAESWDQPGGTAIRVKGPAVGLSYFPDPQPDALSEGTFIPADLLEKSGAGYRIAGRVTDFINVGGRKINPAVVEDILERVPGVRQAVVFGIPDAVRGETPIACVRAETTLDPAALLQECRLKLAAWQVPRDVWLVHEIPTTARGKISRPMLAAEYIRTQGRS
jgi:long-chain acyl-CoA synthetase